MCQWNDKNQMNNGRIFTVPPSSLHNFNQCGAISSIFHIYNFTRGHGFLQEQNF